MICKAREKLVVGDESHHTARCFFCPSMVCATLPEPANMPLDIADFAMEKKEWGWDTVIPFS
jgi:hypothetical protein